MLELSQKFKNQFAQGFSALEAIVTIFPDVKVNEVDTIFDWMKGTTDTASNEVQQKILDKYETKLAYYESMIVMGTSNMALVFGSYNYVVKPLLFDVPKIRNKLDMKTKISKISSLSLQFSKIHNNIEEVDDVEKLYNCAILVHYTGKAASNIKDEILVYTGYIDKITQNKNDYNINCSHLSKYYNDIEMPLKSLPYATNVPDKYKNAPYPLTYGKVDGAYAALEKIVDNTIPTNSPYGLNKFIVYDSSDVEYEGFIDDDMPYQGQPYPDDKYKPTPEASQIYIGRSDNYLTFLKQKPWYFWGDNTQFDTSDVFNETYYKYYYYPQYTNSYVSNGIIAFDYGDWSHKRKNTVSNNVACVQFRDYFSGVSSNSHETNVVNGFDATQDGNMNSGQGSGDGYFVGDDEVPEVLWINSGDIYNQKEFFDKSDLTNQNVNLHFKWWSTYSDFFDLSGSTERTTEIFRGLRVKFESQLDGVDSYLMANMLGFKSRLKIAQWIGQGSVDNSANWTSLDVGNEFNNGANIKPNQYPFSAAACSMNWFIGSIGTDTDAGEDADYEGSVPELYPGSDGYQWPTVIHTRAFPYHLRNGYGGSLPRTYDGSDDVMVSDYYIDNQTLYQNYSYYKKGLDPDDPQEQIMPDSQMFYNQNRKPWDVADSIDRGAVMPYDLYTHHGGWDYGNKNQMWYQPAYNYPSNNQEFKPGGDAGLNNYDGFKWFPRSWNYSDTTETTMIMAPINKKEYGNSDAEGFNVIQHHYCELDIYELWCDRVFLIGEFEESDFFAKIKGRKGFKTLSGGSREYIERPNEIIYDILGSELKYGRDIVANNTIFDKTSTEHISMKNAFSIKERQKTSKVLKNIVNDSRVIIKNTEGGGVVLDSIKKIYTDADVALTIKSNDVVKYKYTSTPLTDIKNQIKIDYEKKYLNNTYLKTSGIFVDDEGVDKYKIMVDGILNRNGYFPGQDTNKQMFNLDEFTSSMYGSLGIDDFVYSIDYYKLDENSTQMRYSAETIRDHITASEVQKYMLLWNCNQHLIIDLDLPLNYFNLEVGDVVDFDSLIENKKAFGRDYTDRYLKNGQVIYPYFMITSTNKTKKGISISVIQLHRLEWGVDGYAGNDYGLGWPQDDQTYNVSGVVPDGDFNTGTDTIELYAPDGLEFGPRPDDSISVGYDNAWSSIDNYELVDIDTDIPAEQVCSVVDFVTSELDGQHRWVLRSQNNNYGNARIIQLNVYFANGHEESLLLTQRADELPIDYWWHDRNSPDGPDNIASRTESGTYHRAGIVWTPDDVDQLWLNPIDETTFPETYQEDWVVPLSDTFPDYPAPAYGIVRLFITDNQEFTVDNADVEVYTGHYNPEGNPEPCDFLEFWEDEVNGTYFDSFYEKYLKVLPFKLAKRNRTLVNLGVNTTPDETYEESSLSRKAHVRFTLSNGNMYTANFTQVGSGWYIVPPDLVGGDVNNDGSVNVLDVVMMVSAIIGGYEIDDIPYDTNDDFVNDAFFDPSDVNQDGILNVLDVVATVQYILGGGTDAVNVTTKVMCVLPDNSIIDGQLGDTDNGGFDTFEEYCESLGGEYWEWGELE